MSAFQATLARIEILLLAPKAGCCRFIMQTIDKLMAQPIKVIGITSSLLRLSSEKYLMINPNKIGCVVLMRHSYETTLKSVYLVIIQLLIPQMQIK